MLSSPFAVFISRGCPHYYHATRPAIGKHVGGLLFGHPRETVYSLSAPPERLLFSRHKRSDRRTQPNMGFLGAPPFLGLSQPESGVNSLVVLGGGAFGIIPRFPRCRRVRLGSSMAIFAKYCSGETSLRRNLFFSRRTFFGAVDIDIPSILIKGLRPFRVAPSRGLVSIF